MSFQSVQASHLYKPADSSDIRLSSFWDTDLPKSFESTINIAGYPCDIGIERNGGRRGAAEAPPVIRKLLSKMTAPAYLERPNVKIVDHGDIQSNLELEFQHKAIIEKVKFVLDRGGKWIGLGGGHDYGYPDCAGFLTHCKTLEESPKPLVVNFDAHLDVRSDKNGITSGTPFYKLLNEFPGEFEFVEIGIQSHCNSKEHFEFAKEKGVTCIWLDEILQSHPGGAEYILDKLSPLILKPRPSFVSVDIDAFSNAYAMGCSQSWSTGLTPEIFFPVFKTLIERTLCKGIGIYEVSPPLDIDDITSKLAAQIAYNYIYESI